VARFAPSDLARFAASDLARFAVSDLARFARRPGIAWTAHQGRPAWEPPADDLRNRNDFARQAALQTNTFVDTASRLHVYWMA
jgi:hypothetical protein